MTTQGIRRPGAAEIRGAMPPGWAVLAEEDGQSFHGPVGRSGRAVRAVVRTHDVGGGNESAQAAAAAVMTSLSTDADVIVANCDVWPHPVWGLGRLVQTAFTQDAETLAHDVYVFVADDCLVRVDVECPLVDLLGHEDSVAELVSRLRPVEEVA